MGILKAEYKNMLLALNKNDITFDLLLDLFGDRSKKDPKTRKLVTVPSKIKTSDTIVLKKGEYFNTQDVTTNAGLFIYNKFIIEGPFENIVGYVNTPIDKKVLAKIEDTLSKALMEDKITTEQFADYLNRTQWLSMQFHSTITSSYTMNLLKPLPEVIKRRDELLKQNKDKLAKGDVITAVQIEKELVGMAEKKLADDPGMTLYKSGARGSFDNNYKNMSIMKGPIFNPVTGKYDIVESNLMEGIRKEELSAYGNAIITGAYPKAIGTAVSGYFSKQIIAALQAITIDEKIKDCGTKKLIDVVLTKESAKEFIYSYIFEGGKYVLLTDENLSSYIGKKIKLRSPMTCISDNLCQLCAGEIFSKLGIKNIGLTAARASSSLLNASMKKFHNSTAQIYSVNIEDVTL